MLSTKPISMQDSDLSFCWLYCNGQVENLINNKEEIGGGFIQFLWGGGGQIVYGFLLMVRG